MPVLAMHAAVAAGERQTRSWLPNDDRAAIAPWGSDRLLVINVDDAVDGVFLFFFFCFFLQRPKAGAGAADDLDTLDVFERSA